MILNATVKHRSKEAEWEFHLLGTPMGDKWFGRMAGSQSPPVRLVGQKLKAAEAAYIRHLESIANAIPAHVNEAGKRSEDPLPDDITPDTIIEAVMYREDVLGPRPRHRVLQRHHVGDSRYYVVQFGQPDGSWGDPQMYAGVTSVTKARNIGHGEHLYEHYASFPSYKDAKHALFLASAKGTIFHSLAAECLTNRLPDFGTSEMDRHLRGHIHSQGIDPEEVIVEWTRFFYKSLLGLKQCCMDYNIEPLAIEVVLGEPHQYFGDGSKTNFGYFAQIDLICFLDIEEEGPWGEPLKSGPNKGQPKVVKRPKRVLAIVDFKTGSSDSRSHDMQLLLQLPLVKAAFPHLVDSIGDIRIFNWHPTDFKTASLAKKAVAGKEIEFGYSMLEKDNNGFTRGWANDELYMWRKYDAYELPMKAIYQGSPNIGTPPSENIRFVPYVQHWIEKIDRAREHKFADI